MSIQRHQIKSECPECGCGLIDDMTPDQYREKHGNIKNKMTDNSSERDKGDEGSGSEKQTAD